MGWAFGLLILALTAVSLLISDPQSVAEQALSPSAIESRMLPSPTPLLPGKQPLNAADIWRVAENPASVSAPKIRGDVQNAKLAEFDRIKIASLQKGDVMQILIPQLNRRYAIQVTGVSVTTNGNRVISGRIDGTPNSSIFTLGAKSLFATVGTPDGIFNVSGNHTYAWIVEARELNRHVDSGEKDYVIANLDES